MKLLPFLLAFMSLSAQAQTKGETPRTMTLTSFVRRTASLQLLTIGELHGTQEAPRTVIQIAKRLKRMGSVVEIGLEVPVDEQGLVDQFFLTGDTGLFRRSPFFTTGPKDGRSGRAMVQLLATLRHIGVPVFCFERRGNTSQERDSLMALEVERRLAPDKVTIVLVGNMHAKKQALSLGEDRPPFFPMMSFLAKRSAISNLSLNLWFGGGHAWLCMEEGCKVQQLPERPDLKARFEKTIKFVFSREKEGYDGFIYLPKATVSYPLF